MSPYLLSSVEGLNEKQSENSFLLEKTKTYFFYNSYSTLDNGEHQFPFFSLLQHFKSVPASVLTSFGCFGSWLFIISLLFSIIIILQSIFVKHLKLNQTDYNYGVFFFIWTLATTALMIFFITGPSNIGNNIRYVAIALFPFTLLVFSSYNFFFSYLEKNIPNKKYMLLILLFLFFSLTLVIAINTYHTTIKIRGGLLSRHTAIDEMVMLIFTDYYHLNIGENAYQVIGGNIRFCSLEPEYIPLSELVLTEINFFNVAQPVTLDNINKNLNIYNTTYIILLLKPISERNEFSSVNATLLTELRPCDHDSLYCKLKNMFKNEKPFFFLYKINPEIYAPSQNYTVACLDHSPF
ncbi:hypothetical protein HZC31_06310 [Candidatus Woesearchaeota archaeon]|nr:hypothetical protein [Candidatus Woesearchaeota archaeon]